MIGKPEIRFPSRRVHIGTGRTHAERAFIVEAIALLMFLAISIAFLTEAFVTALSESTDAGELTTATQLASNSAEDFAASPSAISTTRYFEADGTSSGNPQPNGWTVVRSVAADPSGSGTLYRANIVVFHQNAQACSLDTERYVSAKEANAHA